jgi:hypothetical protein
MVNTLPRKEGRSYAYYLGSGEILEGLGLGPLFWERPNPEALPYTFQMRSLAVALFWSLFQLGHGEKLWDWMELSAAMKC